MAKAITPLRTRQLLALFKKATSEPGYIKYALDPSGDLEVWYILITNILGDDGEFAGGEYLARIEMRDPAPIRKPPSFFFLTPNGLYTPDVIVCIATGEFHATQYQAVGGVARFCNDLISGLLGWREMSGVNLIKTTVDEKKGLAVDSALYNLKHYANIVQHINDTYADYSAAWEKKK